MIYQRPYLLLILMLTSCVVPFEFESQSFGEFLVVDGLVTNETKHHQVVLTRTRPITATDIAYESGAIVYVMDSRGNQFQYQETTAGHYESILAFEGIVGETYQLVITTQDGTTIESNPTEMLAAAPIDSIYGKYAEMPSVELDQVVGGIQFFLDADASAGNARHFRYEWEETWKIKVPYRSYFLYEGPGHDCFSNPYPLRDENVGECYEYGSSDEVLIATAEFSANGAINEFPISFVDQENDRLSTRYSLLIRQYTMNEEAYSFYNRLKENNQSGGSLFDEQKGAIIGNLQATNSTTNVLGYFDVSSVTEKRAFFNPFDFEEPFVRPRYRFKCSEADNDVIRLPESSLDSVMQRTTQGFWLLVHNPCNPEGEAMIAKYFCSDCTRFSSNEVPDFWVD